MAGILKSININFGNKFDVPVELGLGEEFWTYEVIPQIKAFQADKIFIIYDDFLGNESLSQIRRLSKYVDYHEIAVPGGELCKSSEQLVRCAEQLLALGATKASIVVGLGGGSVMNLSGLMAGLLFRGIRLVYIPTTFLAQHDVVPSRKTAISLGGRKNNFGMYYSANKVFIDVTFLSSLGESQFYSGLAELLKNAFILNGDRMTTILDALSALKKDPKCFSKPEWLLPLVAAGINAKKELLQYDESELREAVLFEYGHTLGHAMEFTYSLSHGLSILFGMLFCSYASHAMGFLSESKKQIHDDLIHELLKAAGVSIQFKKQEAKVVLAKAMGDNKRGMAGANSNKIGCVLLKDFGVPLRYKDSFLYPVEKNIFFEWWKTLCTQKTLEKVESIELKCMENINASSSF